MRGAGQTELCVKDLRVAGVMTGTSCDGIDVACVRFDGAGDGLSWRPLWSASAPYPAALRKRVLDAQLPGYGPEMREWLGLHRDLGRWYAAALGKILKGRSPRPHVIANHGQTIAHFPADRLTLQLGDPSLVAHETGLTVACSFREGDMAAFGQGAPLVPRFHALLARKLGAPGRAISIHNLGGVSNLSYFGAGRTLAFDTGPANFWIDAAASLATRGRLKMDLGGKLGRAGRADARAVRSILRHPFFAKPAPKSTGRNEFPMELLLSRTRAKGADLVATATAITIESIALAYENAILRKRLPLQTIYFCGGGAKNPTILEDLAAKLAGVEIRSLQDAGHDPQLVEAQAFAYYGCRALLGLPLGGSWTGARGFAPPAHVIPGENWRTVMSKLREARSPR
jgi:anhydro-N-acetylmuramic acid kinase